MGVLIDIKYWIAVSIIEKNYCQIVNNVNFWKLRGVRYNFHKNGFYCQIIFALELSRYKKYDSFISNIN